MLKAIVFDIDGVITDLSHFHFLAWKSIYSFYGVSLSQKEWKNLAGKPRLWTAQQINKIYKLKIDEKTTDDIVTEKNELFVRLIKHGLKKADVINGVEKLIEQAKERGLKLIAVSTSANAKLEMKCLGLNTKFDYISDYSTNKLASLSRKEKAIISNALFALKSMGLRTDECIGLEDHIDGIREYNRLGIYSVAIANYNDEIKMEANYWVDLPEQISLEEIIFNYYKKDNFDI